MGSTRSKDQAFVHLHVHSDYSLLDGCSHIDQLCAQAHKLGMPALALTDHGNLFGAVDLLNAAKRYELKPLVGCEIYLAYDHRMTERPERSQNRYYHMGLLVKNLTGYHNLIQLVSDAHIKGMYYKPRTDMEALAKHAEGLIGFSGCLRGVIPQYLLQGQYDRARQAMGRFIDILGRENFFVELQDHGIAEQVKVNALLLKLATEFSVKVICSNDVHYVKAEHWAPHETLLCIQTGAKLSDEKRLRYQGRQFYLKTKDEMAQLFHEVPESLTNTVAVAEMCDFDLSYGENHYPVFNLPPDIKTTHPDKASALKHLCAQGLAERYGIRYDKPEENSDPEQANVLIERMDYELDIIAKTGFLDYFLVVWDLVSWARKQGIPVGPGRGSGAGCLVAYLLKITDIDPIRFKLLFERFLNPERISPPDFDIDFCKRRRDEVIDYARKKYGRDCVANIITFGSFGAKMIVRDIARVLDLSYPEADRIAKMVPDDLNITLASALKKSAELRAETRSNPKAREIFEHGKVIEGMVRNTGKHACGIIIADQPLTELIPMTLQEGDFTTQYPKGPVEDIGLLKMDLLGLKTLTVIADAQDNIRRTRNRSDFDIESVPFDDPETFKLLNAAQTAGVFQLESSGMQSLCRQFSISNIDEIIALIALYRPGPMDLIPDYVRGKHDPSTVKYTHPLLEDICEETYGIMVYQEQVMEAARRIAGYSLGKADILRRAMGKKKIKEMTQQRETFIREAQAINGIPPAKAEEIFNLLEKFAGYGFNKSHSAAYAILAYRTAYLKANFPVEFMAAILSAELGNADKVAYFVDACLSMEIPVYGPDINESRENFTPIPEEEEGKGSIRFGLAAVKGVGDAAAAKIIAQRESEGPFKDFSDFATRLDTRTVNRRIHECLIKAGAFDSAGVDRQHLLDTLDATLSTVAALQKDKSAGQTHFFDLMTMKEKAAENGDSSVSVQEKKPGMALRDKLKYEKELLGFYISGHPMTDYRELAAKIDTLTQDTLEQVSDRASFRLCGIISGVDKRITKKDNRAWALFNLITLNASFAVNMYADAFERYGDQLTNETLVVASGSVFKRNGETRLSVQRIEGLDLQIPRLIKKICWVLRPDKKADDFLEKLRADMDQNHGQTRVQIGFLIEENRIVIAETASSLTVRIRCQNFQKLKNHPAVVDVHISVVSV